MLALFVALLATLSHGDAMAQTEYLGEFCFSIDSRREGIPGKTLHLGVLSFGDLHYSAHGKMTVEGRPGVIPVHGAVVKGGDDLVITLSGSDHGRGSDEIKFHAVIGQNPGNYTTIEHRAILESGPPPYSVSEFVDYGYITGIPCPGSAVGGGRAVIR